MAAITVVALFLRLAVMSAQSWGSMAAYRATMLMALGLMSVGAHFGANMVHGNKYLTEYAPAPVAQLVQSVEKWLLSLVPSKPVKKAPPQTPLTTSQGAGDSKLVFQHVILPILAAKCNSCHCEEKSKGDLRMDTYELLLKGGEDAGKTVVPGKPDDSLAVTRTMLPDDDDEHMPPDGKEQLTPEEKGLLKWWIQAGASATQMVKDAGFPAELKATAEAYLAKPSA